MFRSSCPGRTGLAIRPFRSRAFGGRTHPARRAGCAQSFRSWRNESRLTRPGTRLNLRLRGVRGGTSRGHWRDSLPPSSGVTTSPVKLRRGAGPPSLPRRRRRGEPSDDLPPLRGLVSVAKKRSPASDLTIFDFLRDVPPERGCVRACCDREKHGTPPLRTASEVLDLVGAGLLAVPRDELSSRYRRAISFAPRPKARARARATAEKTIVNVARMIFRPMASWSSAMATPNTMTISRTPRARRCAPRSPR